MNPVHREQFLGLPPCEPTQADAVLARIPLEKTVSYGTGTGRGPQAILEASYQVELFDEETLVDFTLAPKIHTLPPLATEASLPECLEAARQLAAQHRDRFFLGVGGEHTVSLGLAPGLVDDLSKLTIVQVDAHADLIDELDGQRLSHGTVMRRLWERGCRLVQIGVRSLSRPEYELAGSDTRITTFFAHRLAEQWHDILHTLQRLEGEVYLSIDVDGLDPGVIPSTGTPQPDGLSWRQTVEVIQAVSRAPDARFCGADVVEFVPSPHPPGCDLIAAKLVAKILAFWWTGRR